MNPMRRFFKRVRFADVGGRITLYDMQVNRRFAWILVMAASGLLAGCSSPAKDDAGPRQPSASAPTAEGNTTRPTPNPTTTPSANTSASGDDHLAGAESYTVNAMVGQVEGKPIYVGKVFGPIESILADLGKSLPRLEFERRARSLILGRLWQLITDALILGEAERALTSRLRFALELHLKKKERELILRHGEGSRELADATLQRKTGKTIKQTLQEERQRVVLEIHQSENIHRKINISRKEIERYYRDHPLEFNKPETRTFHMIRTNQSQAVEQIQRKLSEGEPFLQLAADPALNHYRLDQQGLYGAVGGRTPFGDETIDSVLARLKAGEHSERIVRDNGESWWLYVAAISEGKHRSLREVQLEIKRHLTATRYRLLTKRYQDKLLQGGNFSPIEVMLQLLLRVALDRYAYPE